MQGDLTTHRFSAADSKSDRISSLTQATPDHHVSSEAEQI